MCTLVEAQNLAEGGADLSYQNLLCTFYASCHKESQVIFTVI